MGQTDRIRRVVVHKQIVWTLTAVVGSMLTWRVSSSKITASDHQLARITTSNRWIDSGWVHNKDRGKHSDRRKRYRHVRRRWYWRCRAHGGRKVLPQAISSFTFVLISDLGRIDSNSPTSRIEIPPASIFGSKFSCRPCLQNKKAYRKRKKGLKVIVKFSGFL